jgi:hypothetical protein
MHARLCFPVLQLAGLMFSASCHNALLLLLLVVLLLRHVTCRSVRSCTRVQETMLPKIFVAAAVAAAAAVCDLADQ